MNRTVLFAALMVALGLGSGCLGDAPHDNPLDPNSDQFIDEGDLSGHITDRTEAPLDGAEVHLLPAPTSGKAERVTRTNAQGRFELVGIPSGTGYQLRVHKEGYAVGMLDSLAVEAGLLLAVPVLRLNALPVLTSVTFHTVHISRWWPENDLYFLEVQTEVRDADGLFDIAGVWVEIPDLNFSLPLEPQAAGRFEKSIESDSLPTVSLQALLGRTLRLNARDQQGDSTRSAPQQLVRVIEETPVAAGPQGLALLETDRPTLTWEPFPPAFAFTYRIDVFRDEVNRTVLVETVEEISSDVTSMRLESSLASGAYFWTLSVIDEFGNQSRSKEAGFRIP
ncbi:MAG: carboxypeptidase-like regulatory domain-containing protein [Rhodothermales bacterium]